MGGTASAVALARSPRRTASLLKALQHELERAHGRLSWTSRWARLAACEHRLDRRLDVVLAQHRQGHGPGRSDDPQEGLAFSVTANRYRGTLQRPIYRLLVVAPVVRGRCHAKKPGDG